MSDVVPDFAALRAVFEALPPSARGRCACVCTRWRDALDDLSFWTHLDLSDAPFMSWPVFDKVLRCAVARARGQLASAHVPMCVPNYGRRHLSNSLRAALVPSAGALRDLHLSSHENLYGLNVSLVRDIAVALPALTRFKVEHVFVTEAESKLVVPALRREPPFGALEIVWLSYKHRHGGDEAHTLQLAAEVAAHTSLEGLSLSEAPLGNCVALDAVVDAALARQLTKMLLLNCGLNGGSARALVRLVSDSTRLRSFTISPDQMDVPAAELFGAALRDNTTLTFLCLSRISRADMACALLAALEGHASLGELQLTLWPINCSSPHRRSSAPPLPPSCAPMRRR